MTAKVTVSISDHGSVLHPSSPYLQEGYFVTTCAFLSIAFAVGAAELLAFFLDKGTDEAAAVAVNSDSSSASSQQLRRRRQPSQPVQPMKPLAKSTMSPVPPNVLKWIVLGCLVSCPLASLLQNGWQGGCFRRGDTRSETIVKHIVSTMPPKSTLFTKVRIQTLKLLAHTTD